jgi:hypothetical protein
MLHDQLDAADGRIHAPRAARDARPRDGPDLCHALGKPAGGDPQPVLSFEVSTSDCGAIVDVRRGGNFRAQWEEFPAEPPYPGAGHGQDSSPTGRTLAGIGSEHRGMLFERFLRRGGLERADTSIGPPGEEIFSGITSGRGETVQICIRSQRLADRLNAQIRTSQQLPNSRSPLTTYEAELVRKLGTFRGSAVNFDVGTQG